MPVEVGSNYVGENHRHLACSQLASDQLFSVLFDLT